MALKSVTETIEEKKYRTIVFPARVGVKLTTRVAKFIGPLVSGEGKSANITDFASSLSDENVSSLVLDLLSQTYFIAGTDGHIIDEAFFDEHFAGEYFHLYKVIWFVIKTNGFFGKGDIGKMLKGLGLQPPVSPTV